MEFENKSLLVEEFYEGHEIDCDILVQNNRAVFIGISDNSKPNEGFFETENSCPSFKLNNDERQAIERIITDWIPKLNLQNAVLHFEAFCRPLSLYPTRNYDTEKPFENIQEFFMPIELNLRLGGGETWSMNFAVYGVDLLTSYIDIMLGLKLDETHLQHKQHDPKGSCISHVFFPDRVPCQIESIKIDMAAVSQSANIVELALTAYVGNVFSGVGDLGWLTIVENPRSSYKKLIESKNACAKLVSFEFTDTS
jgi:hypothetical protein